MKICRNQFISADPNRSLIHFNVFSEFFDLREYPKWNDKLPFMTFSYQPDFRIFFFEDVFTASVFTMGLSGIFGICVSQ